MMNELKLLNTILAPHVTEKTINLSYPRRPQYAFKVAPRATKKDIKQAIVRLFNVTVLSVRVVRMKPKMCRVSGRAGVHKGFKKAYITLAEGQQIDLSQKTS